MGTIITQQKGLTDIYYLCSPSPLHRVAPSSSQKIGASLLIYLHIYICCKWKIKKENKNKTNNNNNSKQQVVETFCGYFLKTYQNQSANANKRKNNSKKIKNIDKKHIVKNMWKRFARNAFGKKRTLGKKTHARIVRIVLCTRAPFPCTQAFAT